MPDSIHDPSNEASPAQAKCFHTNNRDMKRTHHKNDQHVRKEESRYRDKQIREEGGGSIVYTTSPYGRLNANWKLRAATSVFLPGDALEEAVARQQEFLTNNTAYAAFVQISYTFTQRI